MIFPIVEMNSAIQSLGDRYKEVGISTPPIVHLIFDLDVSFSCVPHHIDGSTDVLLSRLIPWATLSSPGQQIALFTFSGKMESVCHVASLDVHNCENFIAKHVVNKVPGWKRSTDYSHVLRGNMHFFLQKAKEVRTKALSSKFGDVGGGNVEAMKRAFRTPPLVQNPSQQKVQKEKVFIMIASDGSPRDSDYQETIAMLTEMQTHTGTFFVAFLACATSDVTHEWQRFEFLRYLERSFPLCVELHEVGDLETFASLSDEALNKKLITKKVAAWLRT